MFFGQFQQRPVAALDNLLALKMAEGLADLKQGGVYHLARSGFYEQPKGAYRQEFEQQRRHMVQALGLGKAAAE